MTLGTAVLLFLLVLAGIVVVPIFLREKRTLCVACIILLALIALALAGYIGLTVFLSTQCKTNRLHHNQNTGG